MQRAEAGAYLAVSRTPPRHRYDWNGLRAGRVGGDESRETVDLDHMRQCRPQMDFGC